MGSSWRKNPATFFVVKMGCEEGLCGLIQLFKFAVCKMMYVNNNISINNETPNCQYMHQQIHVTIRHDKAHTALHYITTY